VHYAWLRDGALYDAEGYRLPWREDLVYVPFEGWCLHAAGIGSDFGYPFNPRVAHGFGRAAMIPPRIAIAAWLHTRGATELAGRLSQDDDSVASVRESLAWMRYEAGLRFFMAHDDVRAQREFAICVKLYPDFDTEFGPSARELRRECQRRLAEGRRMPKLNELGQALEPAPQGYTNWTPAEQAKWLVASLDECDARQTGQPGWIELGHDWRAAALFALGSDALPVLNSALDDLRLTRCVGFSRNFVVHRHMLRVRDVANSVIQWIREGRIGGVEPVAAE
jgi:hypothetical protein